MGKLGLLDVVEGHYVSHIVLELYRSGVFERLLEDIDSREIARDLGYDETAFFSMLEYLRKATDLVVRHKPRRYGLNPKYASHDRFGFFIDKFLGAYGPPIESLNETLRSPTLGRNFVNEASLTRAFERLENPGVKGIAGLIREAGFRSLLDLGCGPGTLLRELASADLSFRGWGVDSSATMCATAVGLVSQDGLSRRVRIIRSDVLNLHAHIAARDRRKIDALHARSLLNEFFRSGTREAVLLLKALKRLFEGRQLFVVDYYGKLDRLRDFPLRYRHTLIHDVAQVVSAQGTPPASLRDWAQLYREAGCDVVHAYEGENEGIEWFIHHVQL